MQIDRSRTVSSPKLNGITATSPAIKSQPVDTKIAISTDGEGSSKVPKLSISNGTAPSTSFAGICSDTASGVSSNPDESAYPSPINEAGYECEDLTTQVVHPEPSPSDVSFVTATSKEQLFDTDLSSNTAACLAGFISLSDVTTSNSDLTTQSINSCTINSGSTCSSISAAVDRVLNPATVASTQVNFSADFLHLQYYASNLELLTDTLNPPNLIKTQSNV